MTNLKVNGQVHRVGADADMPLLWVLREELGLTGTKFGCGVAACGACTVHIIDEAVGYDIVPIEALAESTGLPKGTLHAVQQAWVRMQVPQCGYCQSGMIMATVALLKKSPKPSDAEIDGAIGNICRCGTYPRVRRAIRTLTAGMRTGR